MNVHEFRLYNILEYKGDLVQVVGLDLDVEDEHVPFIDVQHLKKLTKSHPDFISHAAFTVFENYQDWENDLKPIPLTDIWLPKLGFEYSNVKTSMNGYYLLIGNSFLVVHNDKVYFMGQPIDHIKYIHQIQNLYFSLTGNDLKIKEL